MTSTEVTAVENVQQAQQGLCIAEALPGPRWICPHISTRPSRATVAETLIQVFVLSPKDVHPCMLALPVPIGENREQ